MKNTSTKGIHKNQIFRASDFPLPIERTVSGTLYARKPTGELVRLQPKKGGKKNKKGR